ncbi:MAG TPA: hypothetical protein VGS22_03435 [Thermoanaerobaculia bacterium]|jgi:hypothetical protein|nr:hypothetical protein [Thermoanaerobaculia bacterium]
MKLPPFTLVYRPGHAGGERKTREKKLIAELGESFEDLPLSLGQLKPMMRSSLLENVERSADRSSSVLSLAVAVNDLRRQAKVETIGFWDLSSQVGGLPRVIEALNKAQTVFTFFDVQAAVPSGLISRPERVIAWAKEKTQAPLDPQVIEEIGNNVIYEDFAERAKGVRSGLGLDHLIGIVPAMVAFEEQDGIYWNFFATSEPQVLLVSTFDISTYARRAKRPFEVAVAGIALSVLLVNLNPALEFHEESRGCLFDFNGNRESIVETFRAGTIEPSCREKIQPKYREAAMAMMAALREIRLPDSPKTSSSGKASRAKESTKKTTGPGNRTARKA